MDRPLFAYVDCPPLKYRKGEKKRPINSRVCGPINSCCCGRDVNIEFTRTTRVIAMCFVYMLMAGTDTSIRASTLPSLFQSPRRSNGPRSFHQDLARVFSLRTICCGDFSSGLFVTGEHCGAAAGGLRGERLGGPAGALPPGGGAELLTVQGRKGDDNIWSSYQ